MAAKYCISLSNIFLFLILMSSITFPQELLTVEDAIKIALENNYSIQIARNEKEIADNNLNIGNAGFLPELDAEGSYQERTITTKQSFLDGRVIDRADAQSDNLTASIALNWTIFDGLEMFASLDQLKELNKLGEVNLRSEIENNLENIISTYYSIVREKKVLDVIRRNIEISEERVSIAQSEREVGTASKFELLQAQVDLNEDKSTLLREELTLSNLKISLNQLISRNVSIDFSVKDTIELKNDLLLDELRAMTLNNNTSILAAQQNINLSDIELRLARSEWYPEINIGGGYDYTKSTSEAGFIASTRSNGFFYGITVSLNLFNGLNTRLRIENAEILIKNSILEFNQIKNNVDAEFLSTYRRYQNSLQLVKLEAENLIAAEENVEIARERLRVGSITSLEFRESQTDLLNAQSRLVTAQFEAKTAEIELLKLSGQIIKEK